MTQTPVAETDFLIAGGGTAGCVLANRLSAPGAEVRLLEAGTDTPPNAVPDDIADVYPRPYYNSAYMWRGLVADQGADGTGAKRPFTQGRVMGGGSSIMGMIALRGQPDDYDTWAAQGAKGWSWPDSLPYFRRLEHDLDFGGELHGNDGPVTIRRHRVDEWPPFSSAIGAAAAKRGWPVVRARQNLIIEPETTVERLLFDGTRCVGVSAIQSGARREFRARRVIVCAGAIQSPAILMRSGIGPVKHLESLGILVVVPLDGVGGNLQNHPVAYLATHIVKGAGNRRSSGRSSSARSATAPATPLNNRET
jgi:5-(hydroxymethyl)furfural/furfural oxidase